MYQVELFIGYCKLAIPYIIVHPGKKTELTGHFAAAHLANIFVVGAIGMIPDPLFIVQLVQGFQVHIPHRKAMLFGGNGLFYPFIEIDIGNIRIFCFAFSQSGFSELTEKVQFVHYNNTVNDKHKKSDQQSIGEPPDGLYRKEFVKIIPEPFSVWPGFYFGFGFPLP